MSTPVTLYFKLTVQRASGPDVSKERLVAEVKYALSDFLLPDDSEYTVLEFANWPAADEIVASGQAAKFLRALALEKKRQYGH